MRKGWIGSLLPLIVAASPASALSPAQLDCPARSAPAGLFGNYTSAMLNPDTPQWSLDNITAEVRKLVADCAARTGVPEDHQGLYGAYEEFRVLHDRITTVLKGFDIDPLEVERLLGIAPGAEDLATSVPDEKIRATIDALNRGGRQIDPDDLSPSGVYNLIFWYGPATQNMYAIGRRLNDS